MLLGFNSAAEFWICVIPTAAIGIYGVITKSLTTVLYGFASFVAGYLFFIMLDHVRKFLRDTRRG